MTNRRIAAAVLGVLGGVLVLASWASFHLRQYPPVYPLFMVVGGTVGFLMVIGGGIMVLKRPRVGAALMLMGTILGGWTVLHYFFPAIFLLLPGIVLALTPNKKQPAVICLAVVIGMAGGYFAFGSMAFVEDPTWLARLLNIYIHIPLGLAFLIWVLLFPVMGFLAAPLVLAKPKVAGILMLMSGIIGPAGFFALGFPEEFWHLAVCAIAGFPLVIAGTIACIKE